MSFYFTYTSHISRTPDLVPSYVFTIQHTRVRFSSQLALLAYFHFHLKSAQAVIYLPLFVITKSLLVSDAIVGIGWRTAKFTPGGRQPCQLPKQVGKVYAKCANHPERNSQLTNGMEPSLQESHN